MLLHANAFSGRNIIKHLHTKTQLLKEMIPKEKCQEQGNDTCTGIAVHLGVKAFAPLLTCDILYKKKWNIKSRIIGKIQEESN